MNHFTPLSTLSLALTLAACGGGGSVEPEQPAPPPSVASQDVAIQFAAVAGFDNTPVACGTPIASLGSTPTTAQLTDLRFYVTDVHLVNDAGEVAPVALDANEWQHTTVNEERVTLIDLENAQGACGAEGTPATNAVLTGKIAPGNYVGLQATVGVPQKLSHSDVMAAPAPLDIMAMGWSWQTGRKFAKVEVNPVDGVTSPSGAGTTVVSTYNLHLASTDCSGNNDGSDTCTKRNLAPLRLNFNPTTQRVVVDIAELFATTDIRTNQSEAVGCMSASSDLDCPSVFAKMGLDLVTGVPTASAQTVFRAAAK